MRSRAWTPGARRWEVALPFEQAGEWARKLGTAPLVAQVLHNRGLRRLDDARRFLAPKLTDLHDPSLLAGAAEAAERIATAVAAGRKIALYGDYDVDGMTGLAILHGCLRLLGCQAEYYVPHRVEEGYGVHAEAVRELVERGAKLIVTVDCGISDAEAVAEAARGGAEAIVTDHHGLPKELPPAAAIVHPALGGYPNPDLCGAGVAFKLAWAVARHVCGEERLPEPVREFLTEAVSLAALGTIADVVPLVGENRVLAHYGLKGIAATRHAGLRALLAAAGLGERTELEADDVGFALGPRLNASGRMAHARQAVELLLGADPARCREIAAHLCRLNEERQEVERGILEQATEMVISRKLDAEGSPAIVLGGEGWHSGVIGIVAGRLAERFGRPTVLVCLRGEAIAHGSCRSVEGFDMREALAACAEHLAGFGGHAMAGGLRIEPGRLDAFAQAFAAHAASVFRAQAAAAPDGAPSAAPAPVLHADARVTFAALGYNTVEALRRLAPFGAGNPPPLVQIDGGKVLNEPRRIGRSGSSVTLHLSDGTASLRAVGFGMGELASGLRVGSIVNVLAEPIISRFNGSANVELKLRDVVVSR